jgi:pimeloyl-ACP methyl ester carboxylesterase
MPPATRYARHGEISIAYQIPGEGPPDLLVAPGFVSPHDLLWADPNVPTFFKRLAPFSRLIVFDKPGTGMSDPVSSVPTVVLARTGSTRSMICVRRSRRSGRGRASGVPVQGRYYIACVVRGGRIVAGRKYPTRQQALEAVGLLT